MQLSTVFRNFLAAHKELSLTLISCSDMFCVPAFLGRLSPNARRAVTSLELLYTGKAPALAFKTLATCVGLRRLRLILCGFETIILLRQQFTGALKLPGVNDCLKLRGLTHVDIHQVPAHCPWWETYFTDINQFREALQVLKRPHDPVRLARLDKKDYPNRLHRSVFGKANVTTRMESKLIGTAPQAD